MNDSDSEVEVVDLTGVTQKNPIQPLSLERGVSAPYTLPEDELQFLSRPSIFSSSVVAPKATPRRPARSPRESPIRPPAKRRVLPVSPAPSDVSIEPGVETKEELKVVSPKPMKSRFNFTGRRVHLTFKTHVPFVDLLSFVKKGRKGKEHVLKQYSIVWENGDSENGYPHTHLALWYQDQQHVASERRWDFRGIHPHIQIVNDDKHWLTIVKEYHLKAPVSLEQSDPIGLESEAESIDRILDGINSEAELYRCKALEGYWHSSAKSAWVKKLWETKQDRVPDVMEGLVLHPWQVDLQTLLDGPVDSRKIYWVMDTVGGKGKSTWANSFESRHSDCYLGASVRHETLTYDIVSSGKKKFYLLDFSRGSLKNQLPYRAIEALKNGVVQASLYHGRKLKMRPPHVVVFSNDGPDTSQLSRDRYVIYDINDLNLVDVTQSYMGN